MQPDFLALKLTPLAESAVRYIVTIEACADVFYGKGYYVLTSNEIDHIRLALAGLHGSTQQWSVRHPPTSSGAKSRFTIAIHPTRDSDQFLVTVSIDSSTGSVATHFHTSPGSVFRFADELNRSWRDYLPDLVELASEVPGSA